LRFRNDKKRERKTQIQTHAHHIHTYRDTRANSTSRAGIIGQREGEKRENEMGKKEEETEEFPTSMVSA